MAHEDFQDVLSALKDWAPLAAPMGVVAGWVLGRRRRDAEANKIESDADAGISNMVTQRLKALIDGYDRRIADLTDEVHRLRDEVKELRKALDQRSRSAVPD